MDSIVLAGIGSNYSLVCACYHRYTKVNYLFCFCLCASTKKTLGVCGKRGRLIIVFESDTKAGALRTFVFGIIRV